MAEPHDHIAVLTRLASPDQNARNRQSWSRGVFLRCSLLPFSASHSMQILEHKCSPLSESPALPGRNSSVKCTLYCNAGAERLPPRYANRNICQSGISTLPESRPVPDRRLPVFLLVAPVTSPGFQAALPLTCGGSCVALAVGHRYQAYRSFISIRARSKF